MTDYWNTFETPISEGWICPVCKKGISPLITVCPCEEIIDYKPIPEQEAFNVKVRYK